MVYLYVEEDIIPESSRWPAYAKSHPYYTVYEGEFDPGRNHIRFNEMVCGRLIRSKAIWFYSFPETRPAILKAWEYMRDHDTFKVPYRVTKPLGRLVAKARQERRSEQMPEPLFLRSKLRPFGEDE